MKESIFKNLMNTKFLFVGVCFLLFSNHLNASGGKFWTHEKMDNDISVSYTVLAPLGKFADWGRAGTGVAKWGQGFEVEFMHYFELGHDENMRVGVGGTMPFYFVPINTEKLNPQMANAFSQDQYSNTNFIAPEHAKWFSWGFGAEGSLLYTVERFSVEATLKLGHMYVYSPKYKLEGGSYVPPEFAQYFPYEGGRRHGTSMYGNFGLQSTVFLTEEIALFGGIGIQYMSPTFHRNLTYVNMVDNEPVIERQHIAANQKMTFMQFRLGVTITFEGD